MAGIVNKVLLIDDDAHQLRALSIVMRRFGFDVVTAIDGNSGFDQAKTERPHLIVCDMQMPHMNGVELKGLLAEHPLTADIPFIFVTARNYQADKIAGLANGADDYITKPFHVEDLVERVRSVLRRHETGRRQGHAEQAARTEEVLRFLFEIRQSIGKEVQCVQRMQWCNALDKHWTLNTRAQIEFRIDQLQGNAVFPLVVVCFSLTGLCAIETRLACDLLSQVVDALHRTLGGGTLLFRLGREHFAVLLPRSASRVPQLENCLRATLSDARDLLGSTVPTLNLVTVIVQQGDPVSRALSQAELDLNAEISGLQP